MKRFCGSSERWGNTPLIACLPFAPSKYWLSVGLFTGAVLDCWEAVGLLTGAILDHWVAIGLFTEFLTETSAKPSACLSYERFEFRLSSNCRPFDRYVCKSWVAVSFLTGMSVRYWAPVDPFDRCRSDYWVPVNRLTESPTDPGDVTTAHVSLSLYGECFCVRRVLRLGWSVLVTVSRYSDPRGFVAASAWPGTSSDSIVITCSLRRDSYQLSPFPGDSHWASAWATAGT